MFTIEAPKPILALIRRCDRESLLDILIGLTLDPTYQSNHNRLLTLIQLALVHARGDRRPSQAHISTLLNGLVDQDSGRHEDVAEDAFCVGVGFAGQERLIINGMYVASDEALQRLLDAVFTEDFPSQDGLLAECTALLAISDTIARLAGLFLNAAGDSIPRQTEWPDDIEALGTLGQATRFSGSALQKLGVSVDTLAPFILKDLTGLNDAPFGRTALNVRPLLRDGDGIVVPAPSFLSPALRLRLTDRIARGVVPRGATTIFHEVQFARWTLFDARTTGARALSNDDVEMPEPGFRLFGDYMHAVLRFDEEKLAHLVVLGCDWHSPPDADIGAARRGSPDFEANLADHLRASFDALRQQFGSDAGLTVIVHDSPGWGLPLALPGEFAPDWFIIGTDAPGLTALFADPAFSLLDCWKMHRQAREIGEAGVRLAIWPDPVDWWTVWRDQGFSFWPETIDVTAFGGIAHQGVDIGGFRHLGRLLGGRHPAPTAYGDARTVERWIGPTTPPSELAKPVYYATIEAIMENFSAVVETDRGLWWVAVGRPPFTPEDRTWLKLLWEGSIEWVLKLAQAAPSAVPRSSDALEIRLLPVPDHIIDASDAPELMRAGPGVPIVNLLLPPDFITLFITEGNAGDKALVTLLAQSIRLALDLPMDDVTLTTWVDKVTADPNLKMIHVTTSGDLALQLDGKVQPAPVRFIQVADAREAERAARQRLAQRPSSGVAVDQVEITGKAETTRALHAFVDDLWQRCRSRLATLDRSSVITLAMRLIEALHRERVSGERGARARQSLYADYGRWAIHTMSGRDGAFRAYRAIIEMAVCEAATTGGRKAALSDIDTMAGEVMALFRTADQSDAVYHDLVAPDLRFRADGAWEASDGGSNAYMQRYLEACIADSIADDIDHYPKLFVTDDSEPPAPDDPMLTAYAAEFGLGMVEVAAIQNALLEIADDLAVDVVDLSEAELISRLDGKADLSTLPAFIKTFTLSPRPRWDKAPAGFSGDDIYPWIFERRLSLMVRPIIRIGDGATARWLYGVRQLQMGLQYASHLLETGTWAKSKLHSAEARAWVDAEVGRRGLAFEVEIGELAEAKDWRTFVNRPMTELGAARKLGDLDVLAVSADGATWIVIECKWFGGARSSREVASWLQDYHGHDGDKLDRHLKRVAWIRENATAVANRLKLATPIRILGRVVTTTPAPLSYLRELPQDAAVLTRRTLKEIL
ncbi:MAG: hypothetical protein P0Y50_14975 [Candidatus Brevundimonas colombiensis]|uniref:Uncharacterized protein n=1 Tax=Candidatus Brevundimonas colombiensis TaxID=3121376 RepID=A0AAJ6BL12_9CAUL|nr:hypothetical protein [Brevundimonas sp.]WEK39817.1 MAG: hypothetical protein P0Y50_14975 [Brevundimonas sp.]